MRYLIKEKFFSIGNNFVIRDERGNPCYDVVGKVFSIGKKLTLYDLKTREKIEIEQRLLKFLPEYNIYLNGRQVGNVKKKFTLFKPKFDIFSIFGDLTIEGSILKHNFDIFLNQNPIASISKKYISLTDTYAVEIDDKINHGFILALVIVLDQIYHDAVNQSPNNNQNTQ